VTDLAQFAGAPCTMDDTEPRNRHPLSMAVACREPSIAFVTLGCVHEHVDRALTCTGCFAELQRAGDTLICPRCADDPQFPHECRVLLRYEVLPDESGPFRALARERRSGRD
jgi:hypothetical protein